MAYFTVDILAPSKIIAQNVPADSLIVPTEMGQINILPGHTHVVAKLDTGMLVVEGEGKKHHFLVTAGICKVLESKITILSVVGENSEEIDVERAQRAQSKAKDVLKNANSMSEEERIKYTRKLARAEIRLKMSLLR